MTDQHVHIPGDNRYVCEDCRPVEYGDVMVSLVLFVLLLSLTLLARKMRK